MTMRGEPQVCRCVRNAKIVRLVNQGVERHVIAERFNISLSHLRVILCMANKRRVQCQTAGFRPPHLTGGRSFCLFSLARNRELQSREFLDLAHLGDWPTLRASELAEAQP